MSTAAVEAPSPAASVTSNVTAADVDIQNEVARLSKIVENQNQIIATRGKTVSELRTKLKEHENAAAQYEQKLRDVSDAKKISIIQLVRLFKDLFVRST